MKLALGGNRVRRGLPALMVLMLGVVGMGCSSGRSATAPGGSAPRASTPTSSPIAIASPTATASPGGANGQYFDGDQRLGPADFPTQGPVAAELGSYDRLGALSASLFITTYWDSSASGGKGSWRYPPDNGFAIGTDGRPVESVVDLVTGTTLDRFGSEYGSFLAPVGAPYAERSLPPQNLNTYDPAYPNNYHEYKVAKPFEVEDGPIAPAFGQPGGGIQFMLDGALIPAAGSSLNVGWLVQNAYLQRLN